jgi:hypothetical protein
MSEKKAIERENEQLYWILYGVLLAFGVQVTYDFIGLYADQRLKVVIGGSIFIGLMLAFLFLVERRLGKR